MRKTGFRMRMALAALLALAVAAPASADAPGISIQVRVKEAQGADPVPVSGAVASGRAGEDVTVEVKECGSVAPFHADGGAETQAGGLWSTQIALLATAQVRAHWRGGTTDPVSVQVHPFMTLTYRGPGRWFVWIRAYDFFGGARAMLERQTGGRWIAVKTFTLKRQPSAGVASTSGTVRAKVKKGTLLRVVLPKSQAGRCYLAGATNTIKA